MCGFAGEFIFAQASADLQIVCTMAGRLVHRGPDEEGRFLSSDGRCAIGFRRLAIIDPAGSHQPMTSAGGAVTVAYNGEIYNFRALRAELAADGATFRTAGDTEVLLHLYDHYGREMVKHLKGMFAFAIYDASAGKLLLARDRLGQKPLWYACLADRIVFASEAKALLRHPLLEGRPDWQALTFYCSMGYIPAPRSAWARVSKLPAGCLLEVSGGPTEPERYWAPCRRDIQATVPEWGELVRERLARVVEEHMVADVPLGALLSGGLDSSIIVALMSRAAGKTGGVRTFTVGFAEAEFDERPVARLLARHCGTDHTEIVAEPPEPEMLDEIIDAYDEPFADSSAVPTFLICRQTRRHVKVALAGDGGDEVFGGYDRYRAVHLAAGMSAPAYLALRLAAALVRPFAPAGERSKLRRFVRLADAVPYPPSIQYFMYRRLFGPQDLAWLFADDFAASLDLEAAEEWFCGLYEEEEALPDEVSRAQRHDLLTYLPDDLLVKTDIASMAASLELRAPMLDHELVELGLSLPTEAKVTRRAGKAILRSAFGEMLPKEVVRRPKQGFAVPLDKWLTGELLEPLKAALLGRSVGGNGIFRPEAIAGLINDQLSGRADHRHRLWALLVLSRWLSRWG